MNTKSYLNQLENIDKRIKDKLSDAQRWKEIAFSRSIGGSKDLSAVKVQSSHNPDKISDAIAKSIDYEEEAKEEAKHLINIKHTIIKQIDGLDNEQSYNILRMYYIENMSLGDIALNMDYTYMGVKKKYKKALEEFEKKYISFYG